MTSQPELAGAVDTNGFNAAQPALDSAPIANLPSGPSTLQARLQRLATWAKPEYLYLIASDEIGLMKIGYSDSPERRFDELQRTSAYPLRLHVTFMVPSGCGRVFEELLHAALRHCRTHGEWFRLGAEELAFFDEQQPFAIPMDKVLLLTHQCQQPQPPKP